MLRKPYYFTSLIGQKDPIELMSAADIDFQVFDVLLWDYLCLLCTCTALILKIDEDDFGGHGALLQEGLFASTSLVLNAPKKVQYSDKLYRCPYCPGKKKLVYHFKDLLQHASDVGRGSMNRETKDKGKHLNKDIGGEDISSEFAGLAIELPTDGAVHDLFVWPWMGIRANVDVECRDGVYLDQCRYAIVEFKKDWAGFYNAMMFEKSFEADHHGKKESYTTPYLVDNKMYCWVALDEHFNSEGVFGDFLQKNGDLMTVADVESQGNRKTGQLISNLTNTIDVLKARLDEIENINPKGLGNIGSQKVE
ncbi:unnamed protein product [Fraxinus pennsylvanica]|uniref:Uncharacterized protein n=1 Tax=Fraxinus pennsylvanica TaxID=56036 RepID=A0AAD1YX84_9LAMI|nr:unnamed protein product [Fraxinus pennsylvanica]